MSTSSKLVSALQTSDALTANGAVTHSSTDSALLDLFAVAGALRQQPEQEVINLWVKAYSDSPKLSLQLLLWLRDCRGGAGERKTFFIIHKWLKINSPEHGKLISNRIPDVGRWKDMWESSVPTEHEILLMIENIGNPLLCKWLPRKGSLFNTLAQRLGKSFRDFRKHLSTTSKTVEQQMSAREWGNIAYKGVPSKAMSIYSGAFGKHDKARFGAYMEDVKSGKTTIHSGTLYPYDLIRDLRSNKNVDVVNEQWKALPTYGNDENMLVIADVSGSMMSTSGGMVAPIDVSISLAIYISERNKGIFKDCFITFTSQPQLQVLKGSLKDRYNQLVGPVGYDTNFIAAFQLILDKALTHKLSQEDLPTKIIAVSDMEFNRCGSSTNFDVIKHKFAEAGYKMPAMVFWNVNGRAGNNPIKLNDENVCLVSGASPSILSGVLGKEISPFDVMMGTINKERYVISEEI